MEEKVNKRAKGPLFTPYEKQVLTEKAERHMEILDNKCNNSKTIFLKQQTWNVITQDFNSTLGVTPRSKKQLKNLLKNMKCRAKNRTVASLRFLNTDYGDLNKGTCVQQTQGVDMDSTDSELPLNIIVKEEPNDDSEGSAPQSSEQQSRESMSLSDTASPGRSRSPEALDNSTVPVVSTDATSLNSDESQNKMYDSTDQKNDAWIPPIYKAIQPKYPVNSAIRSQLNAGYAKIALNAPLNFSNTSSEFQENTYQQPLSGVPHTTLGHSHSQSSTQKNKWRTEPTWNLKSSQDSDKILELAETEHRRKLELMEKEHEMKLDLLEKQHERKMELFALKEEVLMLKKRTLLQKLRAKTDPGNITTGNEMQPF